ncbi:MAG: helix-turn-helix domain-containing protein [Brachymonas sp.]|nr:helix-turn-helix domain-containing protein [Brachymonas sp.]
MSPPPSTQDPLKACVRKSLQQYLKDLQGQEPGNMYDMLLRAVEQPLLHLVMEQTRYNQSKAAQWLGLNRNTLRKKLIEHGLLDAPGKSK